MAIFEFIIRSDNTSLYCERRLKRYLITPVIFILQLGLIFTTVLGVSTTHAADLPIQGHVNYEVPFGSYYYFLTADEACRHPEMSGILVYRPSRFDYSVEDAIGPNEAGNDPGNYTCVDTDGGWTWPAYRCYDSQGIGCGAKPFGMCPIDPENPTPSGGNPIHFLTGAKVENSLDWVSPSEGRFRIERSYNSSDHDIAQGARRSFSEIISGSPSDYANHLDYFGGGWRLEADARIKREFEQYSFEPSNSARYAFDDTGIALSISSGYSMELAVAPDTIRINNDKGWSAEFVKYFETYYDPLPGKPIREIYLISNQTYADGYSQTFTRNNRGRLQQLSDTRGNHADFYYQTYFLRDADKVINVKRIEVFTSQNTTPATPSLTLNYDYNIGTQADHDALIRDPMYGVRIKEGLSGPDEQLWLYSHVTDPTEFSDYDPVNGYFKLLGQLSEVYRGSGLPDSNGALHPYATFAYNSAGQVINSTHYQGADQVQMEFIGADTISVTNPLGKVTSYTYSVVGGVRRIVDEHGLPSSNCAATDISYDSAVTGGGESDVVSSRTERNGAISGFERDPRGLITERTEDDGGADERVTTYEWHPTLRLMTERETTLLRETFTYSSDGQMLTSSQEDIIATSPNFGDIRTTTYTYTTHATGLRLLTEVDGPGVAPGVVDVTTYEYFTDGLLKKVTDPEGLITRIASYDTFGNPKRIEASNEVIWTFGYDVRGRLLKTTRDPSGSPTVTNFTYDAAGNMTSVTNALSNTWTYDYDPANRLTRITAPDGDVVDYVHDAMGNVTSTTYAAVAGGSNTFALTTDFDELGRILQTIGGNGQTTDFAHDLEDNLTVTTDPASGTSTNIYDRLNRLVALEDQGSNQTDLVLDDTDQLTSHTDARSIETTFTYNGFGDMVAEDSPDRGARSYTYDIRGLTTSMTDPRSITTNFEYDNAGRLTAEIHPANTSENITYTYDVSTLAGLEYNKGRLGAISDESGSIETRFRKNGMPFKQRRTVDAHAYDIDYGFTDADELAYIDYPSGRRVSYTYNSSGEITRVRTRATPSDPWEIIVKLGTYEPNGPLVSMEFGGGFTQTRSYDNSYRLTGILDSDGITTLRDLDYGYNSRDLLISITDQLDSNQDEDFTYLNRGMLNTADAPGTYGFLDYNYTNIGERTARKFDTGSGLQTDNYQRNGASNRLNNIAEASTHDRLFTYDAAGNTVLDVRSGGNYSYTYNERGRMDSTSLNGVLQAEYLYNALGQQVQKILPLQSAKIQVLHDLSGNRIAEYFFPLHGPGTTIPVLTREYIWMGDLPVAVIERTGTTTFTTYYIRTDQIDRPTFATDASGAIIWDVTYLPFGGVHTTTGAPINLRFPASGSKPKPACTKTGCETMTPQQEAISRLIPSG